MYSNTNTGVYEIDFFLISSSLHVGSIFSFYLLSSYQIIQVIKTLLTRSGWFIKIERKAIVSKITTQTNEIDRMTTPDEWVMIFFSRILIFSFDV